MGESIPVDLLTVFRQIILVAGLPMLAGQLTRYFLIQRHGLAGFQKAWAPRFPPFSTLVARAWLSRGDGIALVYGTVMRNLSIALALAMNAFGEAGAEASLLIALACIVQVQSAAWYVRLTGRLFGPPSEEAA